MKKLFIITFILFTALAQAQDKKIEREEGIDREEMPEDAFFLIDKIPEKARRLRYYYQTDGEEESFETKFKFKRSIFSVEFGKDGKLQDVEVTLKEKQLPEKTLQNIKTHLEKNHERHKLEKIQAQYLPNSASESSAEKLLLKSLSFDTQQPDNYEIIVAVKNKGKLKKYEMLFNKKGQFKNEREIIRNSYDYLIF
ncbi:hypothetical protein LB467_07795 [Salegentibacter sp. JZCK2]|uniref:hypothetical protein n=1 Tax=Salegentibacter tibetensis TaxID=2873600 RepID=UPI001CCCB50E|nr:hypothetical protein [Salegentibacter tibetensis]MBZ9729590.1 hypothetical protein [Salegentibacter tibetensis]